MRAYEFYLREKGKEHLIGILPERRKNKDRITQEAILNWGRKSWAIIQMSISKLSISSR